MQLIFVMHSIKLQVGKWCLWCTLHTVHTDLVVKGSVHPKEMLLLWRGPAGCSQPLSPYARSRWNWSVASTERTGHILICVQTSPFDRSWLLLNRHSEKHLSVSPAATDQWILTAVGEYNVPEQGGVPPLSSLVWMEKPPPPLQPNLMAEKKNIYY